MTKPWTWKSFSQIIQLQIFNSTVNHALIFVSRQKWVQLKHFSIVFSQNFFNHWFSTSIHCLHQSTPLSGVSLHFCVVHLPSSTASCSVHLSPILPAICPSSVLLSLNHLALISSMTGSLLVTSSFHTFFTRFIPSFISFLSRGGHTLWSGCRGGTLKACWWGAYGRYQLYSYWSNFHQKGVFFFWVWARLEQTSRKRLSHSFNTCSLTLSDSSFNLVPDKTLCSTKLKPLIQLPMKRMFQFQLTILWVTYLKSGNKPKLRFKYWNLINGVFGNIQQNTNNLII